MSNYFRHRVDILYISIYRLWCYSY